MPSWLLNLQIFSPILWIVFLFYGFFYCAKLLSLIKSYLFIFVFIFITLGDGSKNILQFMSKSILPMFSSKSYIGCSLKFSSLIHFEFIFVYGVREHSNFILLHVAVQFSQCHLMKRLFFSIVYSCLLCHRLIDHRFMGLFLGFLCCSTDLYLCFCASTIIF